MKIGIIGAGNIGGNLGKVWVKKGHEIFFGVPDPEKHRELEDALGGKARVGKPNEAAAFGEVVALAVPWKAVPDAVGSCKADLDGKVLIDCTNPVGWDDGPIVAVDTSGAQKIAEIAPGARVVKCFNTLGAEHLLDPKVGGVVADAFVCTDDDEARAIVTRLGEELGFSMIDLGPLRNAKLAEHIAVAWIHLAMKGGLGRNIAFKLLRD